MPDSANDPHCDDVDDAMHYSDLPPDLSGHHSLRQASVLIPLLKQRDEWHVLYIRRTKNINDRHSGQVAFPGGARESDDIDAVSTALRETREEIGINEDNISIVGTLPVYETISFFSVTPVKNRARLFISTNTTASYCGEQALALLLIFCMLFVVKEF